MKKASLIGILVCCSVLLVGCGGQQSKQEAYDACIAEIESVQEQQKVCIHEELKKQGYVDDVDCIRNPENNICEDRARYNTEAEATNTCQKKHISDKSKIDCMNLLH